MNNSGTEAAAIYVTSIVYNQLNYMISQLGENIIKCRTVIKFINLFLSYFHYFSFSYFSIKFCVKLNEENWINLGGIFVDENWLTADGVDVGYKLA